jgi:hypothetical protein
MTDRELLEAAAKAAGMNIEGWAQEDYAVVRDSDGNRLGWDPLRFDSDALRLAVKLELIVDTHGMHTRISLPFAFDALVHEPHNGDPYAATRRAIVRAAAAMVTPSAAGEKPL